MWHLAFHSWKKVGSRSLVCLERGMTRMYGFGKCLKWTPPKEKMHKIVFPSLHYIKHNWLLIYFLISFNIFSICSIFFKHSVILLDIQMDVSINSPY